MGSEATADWRAALALAAEPRLRRVVAMGLGLSIALIVIFYGLVIGAQTGLPREEQLFPVASGERLTLADLVSVESFLFLLGVSILMMVPVASVFSWLFLDDVADAADRIEGGLPPARPLGRWDAFVANANFFGVLAAVNILALIYLYPRIGYWTPVAFWLLNGVILGKEYLQLVLVRRMPQGQARREWWRNLVPATACGTIFAIALTVPLVNVAAPVLGALAFARLGNRVFRARA